MEEGMMGTPTVRLWAISDCGSADAPIMLPGQALCTGIAFEHNFFTFRQGHAFKLGAS